MDLEDDVPEEVYIWETETGDWGVEFDLDDTPPGILYVYTRGRTMKKVIAYKTVKEQ